MANGRTIRQSRLPEIIAQFGQVGPGKIVEAGFEGFQRGQERAAKLQAARLELEKAKQEMEAKRAKEIVEQERQAKIQEFSQLLGRPQDSQIKTGRLTAKGSSGRALISPISGPEEGTQSVPIAAPMDETVSRDLRLSELAGQLEPKEAVKTFLSSQGSEAASDLRGRDIQQFFLVSPTGERRLVSFVETAGGGAGELFDATTGTPISEQERQELGQRGFQLSRATPQLRTDAAGNIMAIDPNIGRRDIEIQAGATPIPEEKIGTVKEINHPLIPPADRKFIAKELSDTKNDPVIRSGLKMLPTLDNVEKFLQEDNKVALDRLGGLTQKLVAQDSGNLAAWEQRDPGSRQLIARLKQWANMNLQGLLANTNKEEMVRVLQITRENIAENVERIADITLDNLTGLFPQLNREAFEKKLGVKKLASELKEGSEREALKRQILRKLKGAQ